MSDDLIAFNTAARSDAHARLTSCLDVPRWVDAVLDGRPYIDVPALLAAADAAAAHLSDDDLAQALARHPRIGERASSQHDAAFSAAEQSGVDGTDADVTTRLAAGNREYERAFNRVFLIRAAGRTASEVLGELDRRLANDPVTERAETVTALREIALLRLRQVV